MRNSDPRGSAPKPLTICFAAGNEGTKGLNRPAGAKNVLEKLGNSSTYRPRDGGIEAETISEVYSGNYDTGFYAKHPGQLRGWPHPSPRGGARAVGSATANHGAQPGE